MDPSLMDRRGDERNGSGGLIWVEEGVRGKGKDEGCEV